MRLREPLLRSIEPVIQKWWQPALIAIGSVVGLGLIVAVIVAYFVAANMVSSPVEQRREYWATRPQQHVDTLLARYQELAASEKIALVTADSLTLEALYLPSANGAAVIMVHDYRSRGSDLLPLAAMFAYHGYGAILPTLRAHGDSDGELISFGHQELQDLEATYHYLMERPEVDPEQIGAFGTALGGALVILYAAENPNIKAVAAESPYDALNRKTLAAMMGLPWPLPGLVAVWLRLRLGFPLDEVAPVERIDQISPRPVFIMQSGADEQLPPRAGQALMDAAGEPRELWYEDYLGHLEFSQLPYLLAGEPDLAQAATFEALIIDYYDRYLLGKEVVAPDDLSN